MSGKITKNELSDSLIQYFIDLIRENSGSSGEGSTTIVAPTYLKSSVEISTKTSSVTIPSSFNFNKSKDLLLVYKNSVYLEEQYDYTISSDSTTISAVDTNDWAADTDTTCLFNFIVIKNVAKG